VAAARNWESLSAAYRERLSRSGITKVAYESGAPVTAARGHAKTPERPSRAAKNPDRYPEYTRKRTVQGGPEGTPQKPTSAPKRKRSAEYLEMQLEAARSRAFRRFVSVALKTGYAWVNTDTIEANVFGGYTSESGAVPGMTLEEARFTAKMTDDDLQVLAAPQYRANPWFYH
jgi:hypothetical protein